jgi:hypothetical protein
MLEAGKYLPRLRPAIDVVPEKDEMGECLLLLSIRQTFLYESLQIFQ